MLKPLTWASVRQSPAISMPTLVEQRATTTDVTIRPNASRPKVSRSSPRSGRIQRPTAKITAICARPMIRLGSILPTRREARPTGAARRRRKVPCRFSIKIDAATDWAVRNTNSTVKPGTRRSVLFRSTCSSANLGTVSSMAISGEVASRSPGGSARAVVASCGNA